MDTNWFKQRLAEKKLSQRALSKLMELDPAAVSLMLRGMRRMTAAEGQQLAVILGFDFTEVMRRAGVQVTEDITMATVVGAIDSAHNVMPLPPAMHRTVVAPPECHAGTLVHQVRDRGSLRDGWMYYVSPIQEDPSLHVGRLCIVGIDKRTHLGYVTAAYLSGSYTIMSISGKEIATEVVPDWVSPVLWIKPNVHG